MVYIHRFKSCNTFHALSWKVFQNQWISLPIRSHTTRRMVNKINKSIIWRLLVTCTGHFAMQNDWSIIALPALYVWVVRWVRRSANNSGVATIIRCGDAPGDRFAICLVQCRTYYFISTWWKPKRRSPLGRSVLSEETFCCLGYGELLIPVDRVSFDLDLSDNCRILLWTIYSQMVSTRYPRSTNYPFAIWYYLLGCFHWWSASGAATVICKARMHRTI